MLLSTYTCADAPGVVVPPLGDVSRVTLRRLVFDLSKRGPAWMQLKWFAEKYLEPRLESCAVARTEAMGQGEACRATTRCTIRCPT